MHTWFQNLNDNAKRTRWFAFRGSVGKDYNHAFFKYEFCSGRAFRFTFEPKEHKTSFVLGLLFFTAYLTFYGLRIPLITKGREYGFYIYEWAVWLFCGRKPDESNTKDPWYYQQVWNPLNWIFGKCIHFDSEIIAAKNYEPIHFEFRGKEYQMDKIKLMNSFWFRSRIPFGLYKKKIVRMDIKINKPPMHSGKGENSWDCDDDGTLGICGPYEGPKPTYENNDEVYEFICRKYCDESMRSIKKYGRAGGDESPRDVSGFKYLGRKKSEGNTESALFAGNK